MQGSVYILIQIYQFFEMIVNTFGRSWKLTCISYLVRNDLYTAKKCTNSKYK